MAELLWAKQQDIAETIDHLATLPIPWFRWFSQKSFGFDSIEELRFAIKYAAKVSKGKWFGFAIDFCTVGRTRYRVWLVPFWRDDSASLARVVKAMGN